VKSLHDYCGEWRAAARRYRRLTPLCEVEAIYCREGTPAQRAAFADALAKMDAYHRAYRERRIKRLEARK